MSRSVLTVTVETVVYLILLAVVGVALPLALAIQGLYFPYAILWVIAAIIVWDQIYRKHLKKQDLKRLPLGSRDAWFFTVTAIFGIIAVGLALVNISSFGTTTTSTTHCISPANVNVTSPNCIKTETVTALPSGGVYADWGPRGAFLVLLGVVSLPAFAAIAIWNILEHRAILSRRTKRAEESKLNDKEKEKETKSKIGFLTKRQQHTIGIIVAGIGIAASILAFFSWGTYYTANQAFAQPHLNCASWAFTDPFQFPGLAGLSYRLPRSLIVNLTVGRTDSFFTFLPPVGFTWKYILSYKFGGPITGSLPAKIQNQSSFSLDQGAQHILRWKFDIFDFTRQNDVFNLTVVGDEMTEQYSAHSGGPFEVDHPAHETRFLNLFLPVYDFNQVSNYTLRQYESFVFYHQRADQVAFAVFGGITSMLSIATQPYGSCGQAYNGTDVWV